MIGSSFLNDFLPALAATIIGGAALLFAGYWFVDLKLHFREQKEQREAEVWKQNEICIKVLTIVREELTSMQADIKRFIRMLNDENVPYVRFETNGLVLLSQGTILDSRGPKPRTTAALLEAYNHAREMNKKLDTLDDMESGPTGVGHKTAVAVATSDDGTAVPAVVKIAGDYDDLLANLYKNILDRLPVLESDLGTALEAVDDELGERAVLT